LIWADRFIEENSNRSDGIASNRNLKEWNLAVIKNLSGFYREGLFFIKVSTFKDLVC